MKMPFPGMDPYLEHPLLWPGFHIQLMVGMARVLNLLLRPRYVASIEERVYLEGPDEQRIPDVLVQKVANGPGKTTTLVQQATRPVILEVEDLEIHEHYLEILDLYQDQKVIAVIELVSPSNKRAGPGRDSYLKKQREVLAKKCHLVEIDLLRRGRHVLCAPQRRARAKAPYDYLISVNRWPKRKRFELYPCLLRERLPVVDLPLVSPDPGAPLDLQAALEQLYDDGSYMLRVKYEEPCVPSLRDADQQWADECWAAFRAARPDLFPSEQSSTS